MQVAHHRLVAEPRARAHEQHPVDELVTVPVVLPAGPRRSARVTGRETGSAVTIVMAPAGGASGHVARPADPGRPQLGPEASRRSGAETTSTPGSWSGGSRARPGAGRQRPWCVPGRVPGGSALGACQVGPPSRAGMFPRERRRTGRYDVAAEIHVGRLIGRGIRADMSLLSRPGPGLVAATSSGDGPGANSWGTGLTQAQMQAAFPRERPHPAGMPTGRPPVRRDAPSYERVVVSRD